MSEKPNDNYSSLSLLTCVTAKQEIYFQVLCPTSPGDLPHNIPVQHKVFVFQCPQIHLLIQSHYDDEVSLIS